MELDRIKKEFAACGCGQRHVCGVRDIRIGSGLVKDAGAVLRENGFPRRLLLVADRDTLAAAAGLADALGGFDVEFLVYDTLRVARMEDVEAVEARLAGGCAAVLAVGTGSVHDTARLACARRRKPLCLFATAPSMDGFASYSAPIVKDGFKTTYPAKCPEVIIGDTKILAAAPAALKSAGFGDMIAKYVALIDWQVSHLVSGEAYCPRVADLTRCAADGIFGRADGILSRDEASAGAIFEGLLLTGIAMSFTGTSRPGSGTEHIQAHYWECMELLDGLTPRYHGTDVGVSTLMVLRFYGELAARAKVCARREQSDWSAVYRAYGPLAPEVKKLNTPDTITDGVDPAELERLWPEIVRIVHGVPAYDVCLSAMRRAGCATTTEELGLSPALKENGWKYHPYMRRRLSLRRLADMLV